MDTLIIIDVQNDFMPGGALPVPFGDKIIAPINKIMRDFDLIVATQDWHPKNHISFASNFPKKNPFDKFMLEGFEQTLCPDHCIQGTYGAQFHTELDTKWIEAIIRKGTDPCIDGYSCFYDNLHKKTTGLAGFLREKGATKLYFCGLAADVCVYYSIKDALLEGFSATLIEEATRYLSESNSEKIKQELMHEKVAIA